MKHARKLCLIFNAVFYLLSGCSPGQKYNLIVTVGEGSGYYRPGYEVPVKTVAFTDDSVFTSWKGGDGYIKDVYSPETVVHIPERDIVIRAEYRNKWSCGVGDLDRIRKEVNASPTQKANASSRHAALSRWWRLMWRQGYDMTAFSETANVLVNIREYTQEVMLTIDKGFSILEDLHSHPAHIEAVQGDPREQETISHTDWPLYHGIDGSQTGYSPDPGPSEGRIAWRFPKSYRSTAHPLVNDGKVYMSSPGIDVIGYSLDEVSGEVVWKARQYGMDFYGTPKSRVSPHLTQDRVIIRAGNLHHILDRKTGHRLNDSEERQNGDSIELMVYEVQKSRFALADASTGRVIRRYDIGKNLAGEPILVGKVIYVFEENGGVYAYPTDSPEPIWHKNLETELRGRPSAGNGQIYAGSRDGRLFALDAEKGEIIWTFEAENPEENAFRFFSNVEETDGKIYVGTASSILLCLDATSGALIWKHPVSDWIRAKPFVLGDRIYTATIDGYLYAIRDTGTFPVEEMKIRLNEHGFTADLAGSEESILATGRDLILYAVSPETFFLRWHHGILDGAWIDENFYRADWTGGLQPSPTIVDGILYCGGMDGFVHALDAETGKEIWRFETGGTTSAAITVAGDQVFLGEISGSGEYYALNRKTGKLQWSTREYGNVWVGAAHVRGRLFFGNMEGMMFGVDPESGKQLWSFDTSKDTPKENWRNMNKRGHGWPPGIYPVPVADATKVYVGSWSGYYFAFDQKTGEMVWRTQTNEGNLEGGLPDSAAPVLWGNYVYVQKIGRILAALDRETGKIKWEWMAPFLQNGTIAAHDNKIFGSYVSAVIIIPYNATIIAFHDVENGSGELWTYNGGGGLTSPVIANGRLITGSSADPFMVSLDPDDGSVIWRTFTGGEMLENVPAIYGNKVYAHFNNGWLYAIE